MLVLSGVYGCYNAINIITKIYKWNELESVFKFWMKRPHRIKKSAKHGLMIFLALLALSGCLIPTVNGINSDGDPNDVEDVSITHFVLCSVP